MSVIKPDIIIPFIYNLEELHSCAVIYVRPQTNKLNYERAIILGCQKYGDIVYLANIGGKIFIDNLLIIEHYSTQYFFAMHSKSIVSEYPEMVEAFEKHFNVPFESADIVNPYEAILKLGITTEKLFNTIVDDSHFMRLYGQTIKKINDIYVINYDIPEILAKYTPEINVFVLSVIFKDQATQLSDLNQAIFENLKTDNSTPIIDEEKYSTHKWHEKVRRTYHISYNHIASMFDMKDFVFSADGSEIAFEEIPLANYLIRNNIISEENLLALKRFSLVYYYDDSGARKLINIQEFADSMTLMECVDLFKRLDLSSIRIN